MNQFNIGRVVGLLGLLLTCCICPLTLNALFLIGSDGHISLYDIVFSILPIDTTPVNTYVIAMQYLCLGSLSLLVLGIGLALVLPRGIRGKFLVILAERDSD